ncbi:MAG: O-antigen ligase family protein [Acidobacteria bacterium]|nr:O-antigen ligase family protein [Acidobacteriota bacterium]
MSSLHSDNVLPGLSRVTGMAGFGLVLVLVVAAPLHYGGITLYGSLWIQVLAFLALAVAILAPAPGRIGAAWIAAASVFGIALTGVLQLVPFSPSLIGKLSASSLQVYEEAAEILGLYGSAAPPMRISIAPTETVATVLLTLAYLAAFLASFLTVTTRARRRIFLFVLIGCALGQVIAITLLEPEGGRRRGSFVNPNHLAAYIEMSLALSAGLIALSLSLRQRHHDPDRTARSLEKTILFVTGGVLLWGSLAVGLGFTQSRGGVLAGALTAVILTALYAGKRALQAAHLSASTLTVALLLGVAFVWSAIGSLPVARLLATDPSGLSGDTRVQLWSLSIDLWKKFPIFGSGLGTFREAFRRVQPLEFTGLVEQAHNDYLQLLVTGGALSMILAAIAVVAGLRVLIMGWMSQPHREESAFILGATGALLSLLLHGVAEFNFSLPAIPVSLALILGAAWRAVGYRASDAEIS